ncbi:hypothetical protein QTP86_001114 [Hemibagrus guttatus]|nr:hypothetical protein QTP86_001114 [Hemibagrus guttatus]
MPYSQSNQSLDGGTPDQDPVMAGPISRFIEYGEYKGNYYGTSLDSIRSVISKNKVCLLDAQPHSLKHLRTVEFKPFVVFVKPPSIQRLRETRKNAKTISGKGDKDTSKPLTVKHCSPHISSHLPLLTSPHVSLSSCLLTSLHGSVSSHLPLLISPHISLSSRLLTSPSPHVSSHLPLLISPHISSHLLLLMPHISLSSCLLMALSPHISLSSHLLMALSPHISSWLCLLTSPHISS